MMPYRGIRVSFAVVALLGTWMAHATPLPVWILQQGNERKPKSFMGVIHSPSQVRDNSRLVYDVDQRAKILSVDGEFYRIIKKVRRLDEKARYEYQRAYGGVTPAKLAPKDWNDSLDRVRLYMVGDSVFLQLNYLIGKWSSSGRMRDTHVWRTVKKASEIRKFNPNRYLNTQAVVLDFGDNGGKALVRLAEERSNTPTIRSGYIHIVPNEFLARRGVIGRPPGPRVYQVQLNTIVFGAPDSVHSETELCSELRYETLGVDSFEALLEMAESDDRPEKKYLPIMDWRDPTSALQPFVVRIGRRSFDVEPVNLDSDAVTNLRNIRKMMYKRTCMQIFLSRLTSLEDGD